MTYTKFTDETNKIFHGIGKEIAQAIVNVGISENVRDSNGENANVVDVLDKLADSGFAISYAINRLADVIASQNAELES